MKFERPISRSAMKELTDSYEEASRLFSLTKNVYYSSQYLHQYIVGNRQSKRKQQEMIDFLAELTDIRMSVVRFSEASYEDFRRGLGWFKCVAGFSFETFQARTPAELVAKFLDKINTLISDFHRWDVPVEKARSAVDRLLNESTYHPSARAKKFLTFVQGYIKYASSYRQRNTEKVNPKSVGSKKVTGPRDSVGIKGSDGKPSGIDSRDASFMGRPVRVNAGGTKAVGGRTHQSLDELRSSLFGSGAESGSSSDRSSDWP